MTNAKINLASRQCVAVVLTTGLTDVSSFYEIWEAVVAVNGMCVRSGHSGTAFLRGTYLLDDDDDDGSFVVGHLY